MILPNRWLLRVALDGCVTSDDYALALAMWGWQWASWLRIGGD
jgi:hypothetical protein